MSLHPYSIHKPLLLALFLFLIFNERILLPLCALRLLELLLAAVLRRAQNRLILRRVFFLLIFADELFDVVIAHFLIN